MYDIKKNPLGIYEKAIPNDFSWKEKMQTAKAAGFDYIEISVDESDERLARLDWSDQEIEEIRSYMKETGIVIPTMCLSGHRRFPFGSKDKATRARAFEIMKKGLIIIIAAVAVVAIWAVSGYNGLVSNEENVKSAWSQVENVYQRRLDLIPNLVATVKGYAEHEKTTLDAVVSARAEATNMKVDANNLTEEQLAEFQAKQGELGMALGRLLAITENYPDLKANQNFLELQSQLEGTENRITVARNAFNTSAQGFNTYIRRFPNNLIASMFSFEKKPYFQAEEGADKAPEVVF